MPLTVAQIETEIVRKVGPLMALVGLDGTTRDGTNSSLRQPIRNALRSLGFDCADPVAVVDTDVSPVTGFYVERLIIQAMLSAYEDIMRLWFAVMQKPPQGLTKEDLIKLRAEMKSDIKQLKLSLTDPIRLKTASRLGYVGEECLRPPLVPNTRHITDSRGWPYR